MFLSRAFLDWAEAFDFAQVEMLRALEASAAGDQEAALALTDSAKAALDLSERMFERACR